MAPSIISPNDKFAVFVLRDGRWSPWTSGGEGYARRECAYLRDSLGMDAQVFTRRAA